MTERAGSCEECRSHRKDPNAIDGWYCNISRRYTSCY